MFKNFVVGVNGHCHWTNLVLRVLITLIQRQEQATRTSGIKCMIPMTGFLDFRFYCTSQADHFIPEAGPCCPFLPQMKTLGTRLLLDTWVASAPMCGSRPLPMEGFWFEPLAPEIHPWLLRPPSPSEFPMTLRGVGCGHFLKPHARTRRVLHHFREFYYT